MKFTIESGCEPVPGYRLVSPLGSGSFGQVWSARGPGGVEQAIKIVQLMNRGAWKELAALKFIRNIRHTALLPLYAMWLLDGDGQPLPDEAWGATSARTAAATTPLEGPAREPVWLVLAMPLADRTLADRLEQCQDEGLKGIPRDELLSYFDQVAQGIDYLNRPIHDLGAGPVGIQHFDIKPSNIVLLGSSALLCDFGIARQLRSDLTQLTVVAGSQPYMAPEVLFGGRGSSRSDQYSAAITYYELRTGHLPERAPAEPTTAEAIPYAPPLAPVFDDLPKAERAVLERATAADPRRRYETVAEMVVALRQAGDVVEPRRAAWTPSPTARGWSVAVWLVLAAAVAWGAWLASRPPVEPVVVRNGDPPPPPVVIPPPVELPPSVPPEEIPATPPGDRPIIDEPGPTVAPPRDPTPEPKPPDSTPEPPPPDTERRTEPPLEPPQPIVPDPQPPPSEPEPVKPAPSEPQPEPQPEPKPEPQPETPKPEPPKPEPPQPEPPPPPPPPATAPFPKEAATRHQADWAKWLRAPVEVQLPSGIELVLLPAGQYTRGSPPGELPERAENERPWDVDVAPFYVSKYEITAGQYAALRNQPSPEAPRLPAVNVSWKDAIVFCNALSRAEGLAPYYDEQVEPDLPRALPQGAAVLGFRLPTETEWEFACRAGTETAFWFGPTITARDAAFDASLLLPGEAPSRPLSGPQPVGSYRPNPFGLYDTHGNVWEWCDDAFERSPYERDALRRVVRGGGWNSVWHALRAAKRDAYQYETTLPFVGFRVVRSATRN